MHCDDFFFQSSCWIIIKPYKELWTLPLSNICGNYVSTMVTRLSRLLGALINAECFLMDKVDPRFRPAAIALMQPEQPVLSGLKSGSL